MNPILEKLQSFRPAIRPVPFGDTTFHVRGLNGEERAAFIRQQIAVNKGERQAVSEAEIVALTLVDEAGQRVIPDGDPAALASVDGQVIRKLATVAYEVSGLLDEARETVRKNSEPSPN